MKTPAIFGVVVLAHCLAIGGIVLIQGCETTTGGSVQPTGGSVMMPPSHVEPEEVQVEIKPVVTEWPTETTDYRVKSGDTLSSIAHRYGLSLSDLVSLNGIGNKNIIRIGQRLVLPGKVNTTKPKRPTDRKRTSSASSGTKPVASGGIYIVKPGDCLGVIAQKYGVKVDDIRQANGVKGERIVVGQKLVIPGVASSRIKQLPVAGNNVPKPVGHIAKPVDVKVTDAAVKDKPANIVEKPVRPKTVMTETHVVQKGEDLRRISMQWLVSEEKIRTHNNLVGNDLKPGQVLLIPLSE